MEKPEFSDVHRLQNALLEGFHRAVNHKANKSLCNRLVNQISVQMNPIQSHNWTFDFQESSVCYYLFFYKIHQLAFLNKLKQYFGHKGTKFGLR